MKSFVIFFLALTFAGCAGSPSAPQPTALAALQKAPDENAAIAATVAVNAAQKVYLARYHRYALSYEELMQGVFLKEEPVPEKTGYEINLRPSADAARYTIVAAPATASPTARHFFSDQTGNIRAELGKEANAQSPPITLPH